MLLKITIIKAFQIPSERCTIEFRCSNTITIKIFNYQLHKERPRGSYNLKIMRDFKQRTSKGKLIKKSQLQ